MELDVLVVAPHPDDAELGMGGAILQMKVDGLRVGVLDLSDGEPTPLGSREARRREASEASRLLGLDWRECLGLPNRSLEATLEARWQLAGAFRKLRPRLVFCPYWEDAHPDHVAACRLVEAARFWSKLTKSDIPGEPAALPRLWYYFCTHLRMHPKPAFVLDISAQLEGKMAAIAAYRSQFGADLSDPRHAILEDIRARARYWGWAIGREYGEPFASREEVGVSSVTQLL